MFEIPARRRGGTNLAWACATFYGIVAGGWALAGPSEVVKKRRARRGTRSETG
jgi:hypothetical protein